MTKATNAYELLEQVCAAIAANPLNYYQGYWRTQRGARGSLTTSSLPRELDTPENHCGTAFCRAGWIVQLHDGGRVPRDYERRARAILGMRATDDWTQVDRDINDLFSGSACWAAGNPGTKTYSRRGVSGLRAFMEKYAGHLKATAVSPKPATKRA